MSAGRCDATIGILTYRSKELLRGCLRSIFDVAWRRNYDVMVIDNASGDGTAEMVESEFPSVDLVRNPTNVGVAPARNQIFNRAAGRYVIILDVDTLVHPGSFDVLLDVMDKNPDAAIAGPRLVYRDGALQLSCRPFPNPLNIVLEGTFLRELFSKSRFVVNYTMEGWDHAEQRDVGWMYGAALVVRKSALAKIGLFDEGFFYLYEDIDLCFRARQAGFRNLYVPDAVVTHFLDRERKGVFHPRIGTHVRSITRYLLKDYYGVAFRGGEPSLVEEATT